MIEWRRQHHNPFNGEQEVRIKLIGVGGTGSNVLDRVLLDGIDKADLVAVNTDIQSLRSSVASRKVQLGKTLTCGLGAGGDPEVGYMAALEAEKELLEVLDGVPLLFICVGLGGGTGSGAAPVIANLARQQGSFVVVFATLPFEFEGKRRVQQAQQALDQIYQSADCVICFENERLGEAVLPKAGIHKAFSFADQTISQSVRAIATLVNTPGLIEIGFDELLTVMRNHEPRCLFGYGEAEGADRALEALNESLKNPLMDRGRLLSGADSVLVNITGGETLTLSEVSTLMTELNKHIHDNTHILMGAAVDKRLGQKLSVTIISSISNEDYGLLSDRKPRVQSQPRESLPGTGSGSGGGSSGSLGTGAFAAASGEGAHPEALSILPGSRLKETTHQYPGPGSRIMPNPWRRGDNDAPAAARPTLGARPESTTSRDTEDPAAAPARPDIVPSTKLGDFIFGDQEISDDELGEYDDLPEDDLRDGAGLPDDPEEEEGEDLAREEFADVTSSALSPEAAEDDALPAKPKPLMASPIRIGPVRLSSLKDYGPAPDEEVGAETVEDAAPRRRILEESDPDDVVPLKPAPVPMPEPAPAAGNHPGARPSPIVGRIAAPEHALPAAKPASAEEVVPEPGDDRGRFVEGEPTLIEGQDFDVPTFLRRGVKLGRR